jgi:hypothetical protein
MIATLVVGAFVLIVSAFGATGANDSPAGTNTQKPPGFPATDPTRSLAATRITALDPIAGWGGGPDATVFEGLPASHSAQGAAQWWATVLAVGANVKGGHVLGVGIVTSAKNLDEGRPSDRVGGDGWSSGITAAQIEATIRLAADVQGYRVKRLYVRSTSAGPAVGVTVTPATSDHAVAYLLDHSPFRVLQLQRKAAVFSQIVDSADRVVYTDGEVPHTVTLTWAVPRLRCIYSLPVAASACG